jgi:hypothetical protein
MRAIEMGTHDVELICPDCSMVVIVGVELSTIRTRGTDEATTLKLRAKSGKTVHICWQPSLFDENADTTRPVQDEPPL